jgi:hypothetical protein
MNPLQDSFDEKTCLKLFPELQGETIQISDSQEALPINSIE